MTYRPLTKDLKPSFIRLFSNLSRSNAFTPQSHQWEDLSSADGRLVKPSSKRGFQVQDVSNFRELNVKALKGQLYDINVSVPPRKSKGTVTPEEGLLTP